MSAAAGPLWRTPASRVGPDGALDLLDVVSPAPSKLRRPSGQDQGAFGHRLAEAFRLETAQTLTTATFKSAQMAATRLTSGAGVEMTGPIPTEKAYLVGLQLKPVRHGQLWIDGKRVAEGPLAEGSITIAHLEAEPRYQLLDSFDCLQLYIPQILFDELAGDFGAPRISEFPSRTPCVDPILQQLGRVLLPSLEAPGPLGRLFFDHIAMAIYAHLAATYGACTEMPVRRARQLTAKQERVAKEVLAADLTGDPAIEDASRACGLPQGRFIRAFRESTGMPPHRWIRTIRVERAKDLLFNSSKALAQIAYECGFSDQSHFTRVFTASVGLTPGAWRRSRCG